MYDDVPARLLQSIYRALDVDREWREILEQITSEFDAYAGSWESSRCMATSGRPTARWLIPAWMHLAILDHARYWTRYRPTMMDAPGFIRPQPWRCSTSCCRSITPMLITGLTSIYWRRSTNLRRPKLRRPHDSPRATPSMRSPTIAAARGRRCARTSSVSCGRRARTGRRS